MIIYKIIIYNKTYTIIHNKYLVISNFICLHILFLKFNFTCFTLIEEEIK